MRYSRSYIGKLIFIVMGTVIGLASLFYSNYIAQELAIKEKREINLWSHAIQMQALGDPRSNIIIELTNRSTSIPAIVIDEFMRVVDWQNVDSVAITNSVHLRRMLEGMASPSRQPIAIQLANGRHLTIFYDESPLLKSLFWFPFLQILIIGIFIIFAMITFRSAKQSEQNKVWIGMSKETAHQLGTPTSSLIGWVEYLKTLEGVSGEVVEEINKDVVRLTKVVDRFSKIGSSTQLSPASIYDMTRSVVDYFQTRIPRNVTLSLLIQDNAPLQVMMNYSLMEWVLENLIKNALDAMGGKGELQVVLSTTGKYVMVDVKDSGKGMPKANFKRIFTPGFTTKTRGWGLGLSLSRRIVESYHYGKIFVLSSEIDKGTTIRVQLKKF